MGLGDGPNTARARVYVITQFPTLSDDEGRRARAATAAGSPGEGGVIAGRPGQAGAEAAQSLPTPAMFRSGSSPTEPAGTTPRPTLKAAKAQVGLLPETVDVNLGRGRDSAKSPALTVELGITAEIASKGAPAPIQAGKRWVVERTHSWMNDYGKLRRCADTSYQVEGATGPRAIRTSASWRQPREE